MYGIIYQNLVLNTLIISLPLQASNFFLKIFNLLSYLPRRISFARRNRPEGQLDCITQAFIAPWRVDSRMQTMISIHLRSLVSSAKGLSVLEWIKINKTQAVNHSPRKRHILTPPFWGQRTNKLFEWLHAVWLRLRKVQRWSGRVPERGMVVG